MFVRNERDFSVLCPGLSERKSMELNAEFADSRHPFAGVLAISVVALLLILPG